MDSRPCNGVRACEPGSFPVLNQRVMTKLFTDSTFNVGLFPCGLESTLRRRHRYKRHRKTKKGKRAGKRRKRLKCERLGLKNIRILYWNCCSVKQRRPIIDKLILGADIIVLQETQLGDGAMAAPGFLCYYNRRHLGQIILVRDYLKPEEIDMPGLNCDDVQVHAVRVQLPTPLVIVNVYACNGKMDVQGWQKLLYTNESNIIFCGDFNARGRQWGNDITNKQGEDLEDALITTDLVCINNGCKTRLAGRPGDSDSAIDLALMSPALSVKCRWTVLGYYGSDHYPCVVLIEKSRTKLHKHRINTFHYDNTDENIISKIRRNKMNPVRTVRKVLAQPPWWNKEVQKAWVEKRRTVKCWQKARKTITASPERIQILKAEVNEKMDYFKLCAGEAKNEKWGEFCRKVCSDKSLKSFWHLHRKMNGTLQCRVIRDFQNIDQTWQRSDENKGTALLARYLDQTNQNDMNERQQIKLMIADLCVEAPESDKLLITTDEVHEMLKRSNNTAPGPDGVTYNDISRLSDNDIEALTGEFNTSIKNSHIPEEWLHSYLIPLPKPHKDHSQINGYRIITLQNTVGKLLEKIIARKLSYNLEQHGIFPPTLGGYRCNRETWLNAAVFAYEVFEGFHNHEETCAVALDLEDAYNRVQFGYLVHLLQEFEVHPHFVGWIAAALFQRKVALKCGDWTSDPITICPGLPQGSPLSPVLFNVYTVAITAQQLSGNGRTLSFADDILVYRHGKNRETIVSTMQDELDRIASWCNDSKAHINPTKATVTWFSLNNLIARTDMPVVEIAGEDIPRTNLMTYLGVRFDRSLRFSAHIDHVITKSRVGLSAMKIMAAANIEQRLLVLLFQGLVLAPVEYASAILTVSPTQIERLERVQNEAMRIILGCTRDTPCVTMRYLLDFPTMETRINIWKAKTYLRISANTDHPLHTELGKKKGNRLKRGKSWLGQAEDVVRQVCEPINIDTGAEWVIIPPELRDVFRCIVRLGRECREQNPILVNAEIDALVDENSNPADAVIYTDGSVIRNQQSAWAYTVRKNGRTVHEANGAYAMTTSSMTMEIMAVTKAFVWLESQEYNNICVLSDSMSMIKRVQTGFIRRQWLESLQRTQTCRVTFIFVPGHAGVKGNVRADQLANMAVMLDGRPMDRADIINNLRDMRRFDDFERHAMTSLSRMYELEVKIGVARTERLSGCARRIVNQSRTGTISRNTLMEILRRRSEHLWSCPMCRDDDP